MLSTPLASERELAVRQAVRLRARLADDRRIRLVRARVLGDATDRRAVGTLDGSPLEARPHD